MLQASVGKTHSKEMNTFSAEWYPMQIKYSHPLKPHLSFNQYVIYN